MPGPAVTLVDSGGYPVTPVADNAPTMSVVDSGGIAVTVTDNGTPFVLQGFPVPSWTVDPFIVPAGGNVGDTFSGSDGTITNGTVTARAWLLDGVIIPGEESSTITPTEAGSLVFRVTAEGIGGAATKDSAPVTVNAPPVESPFAPFTVTAASGNDGDTGYYSTIYGGISAEPLAGFPLLEFSTRNANYTQVAFTGDCVATVTGWLPVITGVTIGAVISDWAFDGTYTTGTWNSTGVMAVASEYPITWVQG